MKMRKILLAIALSLPYSLPAIAYNLSDLEKLEKLEKLEELKKLRRLQQLEQEAKTEGLQFEPSYYFRLSAGGSSCVQEEPKIPASLSNAGNLLLMSNLAKRHGHSFACGVSLGMYCTKSLRVELGLNYMQNMIFGCDMAVNTGGRWVKLKNIPLGVLAKVAGRLMSVSIPSAALECKLCWDVFSGSLGSFFVTGGACMQSLFTDPETQIEDQFVLPGNTVGIGAALNITQNTSLTLEVNAIYLTSSHLLEDANVKIESWYGYSSLVGVRYSF